MAQNGIYKIAVVGAESTGKSWLCEALARHYQAEWVPEYARDYFHGSDIYNYTLSDLETIAQQQLALEEAGLLRTKRFLFCDTTLITLKIWAQLEFATVPPFIREKLKETQYDHYFLTNNDIPWTEDPLRQNKFSRALLFEMNKSEIGLLNGAYTVITGKDELRLQQAIRRIDSLFG